MLPVTLARVTSEVVAICHVLPVLWMASCFHIVTDDRQREFGVYAQSLARGRQHRGAESDVDDCLAIRR